MSDRSGKAEERFMSSLDAKEMPFGKYKGKRVDTVADDDPGYLRWLLDMDDIDLHRCGVHDYIREALRRRGELHE